MISDPAATDPKATAGENNTVQLEAELQKKMKLLQQEELELEKLTHLPVATCRAAKRITKEKGPTRHSPKIKKAAELKAAREFQQAERAAFSAEAEPVDTKAEARRGRRKVAKGGLSALRGLLGNVDAPQRKW